MLSRISKAIDRAILKRKLDGWAAQVDMLAEQFRTFDRNMAHAVDQLAAAKKQLSELDRAPLRVFRAPGSPRRDGVVRFTLIEDKPRRYQSPNIAPKNRKSRNG
jgi:hypothetical protein